MTSTASFGGHPIHAILIAFPVALFATVLLFDFIYVFRGRDPFWARCSFAVLMVGVLGTVAAVIPGLIDYFTLQMVTTATWHLAVGITVTLLFILQAALRRPREKGSIPSVILPLSILGMMLVGLQGWLGGELVYRYHVGVQPTETNRQGPNKLPTGVDASKAGVPADKMASTTASSAMPPAQLALAQKAFSAQCAGCHKISGAGGEMGPDLSHEGTLHDAAWIGVQIANPKAHQHNSGMPPFSKIPGATRDAIAMYLASLK
nr:DUF2231 domain-containing protein [Armatimonadota bacterium]